MVTQIYFSIPLERNGNVTIFNSSQFIGVFQVLEQPNDKLLGFYDQKYNVFLSVQEAEGIFGAALYYDRPTDVIPMMQFPEEPADEALIQPDRDW